MDSNQWTMAAIFIATIAALVKYQKIPQRVFITASLACLAMSFVSVQELLQNATNEGLATLVLLVICSFALERTSFLRRIAYQLIRSNPARSYINTLSATAVASAFMNNTAVVAALMSPVKNNRIVNPSKLLLPLSYAAILGGTLTLVGTSTNLIVNSMLIKQGSPALGFFDFSVVGATALICCIVVIFLNLRSLPSQTIEKTETTEYFVEAEVEENSGLIGKSIEDNGLRNLDSLFLIEVIRQNQLISPVAPGFIIQANDRLIFTGDISKLLVLQQFPGLKLYVELNELVERNLTEVLIKPESAIVGKSLKTAGFRARFDAGVVAIRREGSRLSGKLGDVVLQAGDFLVLTAGKDFADRTNLSKNFFILSGVKPDDMLLGWRDKSTLLGFIACIAVTVATAVPLVTCLIFYCAFLVGTKALSVNEIKRRFPIEIWLMVLGALTLANGIENTGLARVIADNIEILLDGKGVMIAFVMIFIVTLVVTELITNNAAAVLVFPIAYNIAIGLGVSPMPFIMAVAFAASGSFISPYGYQTNVMVYNAGNYKLMDFVKFGLPVSIVYSLVMIVMIPFVFPF